VLLSSPRDKSSIALRRPRGIAAVVVRENKPPACFLIRVTVLQEINYFILYASIQGSHFGGGFVIFVGETCGLPRANAVRPYGVGDTLVSPFLFMNFSAGSSPHTSIGGSICKELSRPIYFLPFFMVQSN